MTCIKFHPATVSPNDPQTGSLAQCEKYNRYPMRNIPWGGAHICQEPDASPETCWWDFRSCRKAQMARRIYAYSTLGETDPLGNPQVGLVTVDDAGRKFYCLHRGGKWVHDGEHDLPVNVPVTSNAPLD